jgi:hypothetical protein
MSHSPVHPHDPIEEIQTDVFMVRGCIPLNALMRISRNMAIVRHAGELTLVDPIRLSGAEEKRLESMGEVKRILRLGPMHGVDDPYYIERYGAELWAQAVSETYPEPAPHVRVDAATPLPFPDAELFCFAGLKQPESALLIRREGGLLLTCDGIQSYGDYRHNNLPARLMMPFIGFPKTTIIGPFWLKLMTEDSGVLEQEFRRLLGLEFDKLLSAHGALVRSGAHAAVAAAVEKTFARARE